MPELKRRIVKLLRKHHYWRDIEFDELSEIYISMMFRSFALSIISVFVPLYLYSLGYPVVDIFLIIAWYYTFRIGINYLAGHIVAAAGAKHTILISYLFQLLIYAMFLTLPSYPWPLPLMAAFWAASNSLYWVAYHVNFSKVKHSQHGGKEVGTIHIVQRIGYTIGPVGGGLLATFFGAQYTFLVAGIFLFIGILPLLSTREQVKFNRLLDLRKIPLRKIMPEMFSYAVLSVDDIAGWYFWPFFMSLFLLGDLAFAKLGIITSISMIAAIVSAKILGKLTDKHHGRPLYRVGRLGTALVHMARPFIGGPIVAFGSNLLFEFFGVMVSLPFYKGIYDQCDEFGERRIEFVTLWEMGSCAVVAVVAWAAVLALGTFTTFMTLALIFLMAGIMSSAAILVERFKALD